jgi:hypothetical protein
MISSTALRDATVFFIRNKRYRVFISVANASSLAVEKGPAEGAGIVLEYADRG